MKFAFVAAEKASFSVAFMCRHLEVSRSGFYASQRRPESPRAKEDQRLRVGIRAAWKRSRRTYGSHRLHEDLKEDGEKVSRKRVLRLMKEDNVVGKQRRRRFVVTTDSKHKLPIAPNVLDRQFAVSHPNRAWVGDITYLRTIEGWLYLAVIIDLFSRRVVGWAIEEHMETSLVTSALDMALRRRHIDGELLHHTDRGSQGGFKRSSQHLDNGELRWEQQSEEGHIVLGVLRCGLRVIRQLGGVSTGSVSGKESAAGCRPLGGRRLHRQLLQLDQKTLVAGLSKPYRLRSISSDGPGCCITKVSTESGPLQGHVHMFERAAAEEGIALPHRKERDLWSLQAEEVEGVNTSRRRVCVHAGKVLTEQI